MPQVSELAARTNSKNYKVLYSFGASPDGNGPHSDLIGTGDTFYGTTFAGGANYCGSSSCGTVFSITTGGAEKVLHSFADDGDGYFPFAGLTSVDGTLYGTTAAGGGGSSVGECVDKKGDIVITNSAKSGQIPEYAHSTRVAAEAVVAAHLLLSAPHVNMRRGNAGRQRPEIASSSSVVARLVCCAARLQPVAGAERRRAEPSGRVVYREEQGK
jgi:uncharacterized repeat protein (TIGR03803 family)